MKKILAWGMVMALTASNAFGFGVGGGWNPPGGASDGQMLSWDSATNSIVWTTGTGTGDLLAANNLSDVTNLGTAQANLHIDSILTALGLADDDTHFGLFDGSTIADNLSAKAAFQALETAVETKVTSGGALGTPLSGNLTNCTFPTLNQNTSGTAAGLSSSPTITVNGIIYTVLTSAPGTPVNGQRAVADGDTWQPGGATQGTDDWLVVYRTSDTSWVGEYNVTDGEMIVSTAVAAKLNRYHQTAHINPDVVYTNNAGVFVLDPKTAAAITITDISVYLNEDPTNELTITCYHKPAAIAYTGGTTIDANDTVAGTFAATSAFDDATVPAGSKLWCVIGDDPDATTTSLEMSITGTFD